MNAAQQENKKVIESYLARLAPLRPRIKSIYLFGSRARGVALPGADYDLLFIADKRTRELKDSINEAAVDFFLETGQDISPKILSSQEAERMRALAVPFINNIEREGIKID